MAQEQVKSGDFVSNLGKVYGIYTGGFFAFVLFLALLEQMGVPNRFIGYGFVFLTIAVYAVIGIMSRTSEAGEYYVAGRRVPAFYNGMATGADWMSAASFVGMAGSLFLLGYDGIAFVLGWTGGYVLVAILIAPFLRKFGAYTVPDFFAERYEGSLPRLLAVIVLICCSFTYVTAQIYGTGLIASRFLGINFTIAVYVGLAGILLCSMLGGMKAVTWTQVAQYIVLIVAYLTPIIILSAKKYNLPIPELTYGQAIAQIGELEKSMVTKGIATAATLKPHAQPFQTYDPLNYFALILCLMVGTASLPHILMRYFTTPSVRDARTSVAWSLFFIFLLYFSAPAYAAFSKLEVYSMLNAGTNITKLPDWIRTYTDIGLVSIYGVSTQALKFAINSIKEATAAGATDARAVFGALQKIYAAEPWHTTWTGFSIWPDHIKSWNSLAPAIQDFVFNQVKANPAITADQLWQPAMKLAADAAGATDGVLRHGGLGLNNRAGLGIDTDVIVLSTPEIAGMPYVIAGLVAAGGLAAALSTADGLLLAIANALSHDIYYKMLDPNAPTQRRLVVARILLVLVALLSASAAATKPSDILAMVSWAFSLAAAGIFPALVMGIWWKRANWAGCVAGMILGFGVCFYYLWWSRYFAVTFYETWSFLSGASPAAIKRYADLKQAWMAAAPGPARDLAYLALDAHAQTIANWWGVRNLSAALFGLPVGFIAVWLVSLATPAPSQRIYDMVDATRRPRGETIVSDKGAAVPAH